MSPIRPPRFEKQRFFLGCEGESEVAYGVRVQELVSEQRNDVYLRSVPLRPGGGDPLTLVQTACSKLEQEALRTSGLSYKSKWILLDSDLKDKDKTQAVAAIKLSKENDINLIWQRPCHEGFLLRHIKGFATHRPQTNALAEEKLQRQWPTYRKNMSGGKLAALIGHAELARAASVEPELQDFLLDLGYILSTDF